jgi:predicted Zn-dependent protease
MSLHVILLAALLAASDADGPSVEPGTHAAISQPPPAFHPDERDPRQRLLAALVAELDRAKSGLKLKGHEAPYYLGYAVRGISSMEVGGKYGAVYLDTNRRERRLQVDVRVGSYEFDNTGAQEMFDLDAGDTAYQAGREAPLDQDGTALRNSVWLLTDEAYKKALNAYLKKKAKDVYRVDDPSRPSSFSREAPQVAVQPPKAHPFDRAAWQDEVRRQTARLSQFAELFDSQMRVGVEHEERELANTEGTRLVTEGVIYGLHVQAFARAPDGMLLENSRDFYSSTEESLPRGAALQARVDEMVAELLALRKAPVLDPYTGPALLAPEAAGVLFHEAVGHRLEGERQNDDKDGRTFKNQVGKQIIPPFLSIEDDPTSARFGERSLNGSYQFDDQGVPGKRTVLVEDGVLRTFLMSRAPVPGFARSNGHGRAAPGRDPVARMANLIVRSSRTKTREELKQLLIEEARRQGKPFGLLIQDVTGGNTDTSGYAYQAFKGQPRLVYAVDAKTGEERLVRGVEVVGTPLTSINKIVATGDDARVFNGYCGAESGFVPVSTVAPTVLIQEIELQRTRKDTGRPPLLPSPWSKAASLQNR